MSGFLTGIMPNNVYSSDDILNGAPRAGTQGVYVDANGFEREVVMCLVAAAQNLTDGTLVTIDPSNSYAVTVAAAGPPAAKAANRLGVCICSVTASASQYIWVQVFGPCSVLATASTLPNVALTMSGTAGQVDDATSSTSAYISGLVLQVTTGATGLTAAFLQYPRFEYPSASL